MEEIINIANQTIEQLNEIINEETKNTSTEETDVLDARLNTFQIALDSLVGTNNRLEGALDLKYLLQIFVGKNS